jgi:hypothetical protein
VDKRFVDKRFVDKACGTSLGGMQTSERMAPRQWQTPLLPASAAATAIAGSARVFAAPRAQSAHSCCLAALVSRADPCLRPVRSRPIASA